MRRRGTLRPQIPDACMLICALLVHNLSSAQEAPPDPSLKVHSGSFAVRLTNTTPDDCRDADIGFDRYNRTFKGAAGHRLKVAFWLRNGSDSACVLKRISMGLFVDAASRYWLHKDVHWLMGHAVGSAWEYHEMLMEVPESSPWLNFSIRIEPGSTLLVDDVSIQDLDDGNKELMTNGGFEDWPQSLRLPSPPGWRFFNTACSRGSAERILGKAPALTWRTDLVEARAQAVKSRRLLLIFFQSPAPEIAEQREKIFEDPELALLLRDKFILLRLNLAQDAELAMQMKVFHAGTICVYNGDGTGLLRIDEKLRPSELLVRLRNVEQ